MLVLLSLSLIKREFVTMQAISGIRAVDVQERSALPLSEVAGRVDQLVTDGRAVHGVDLVVKRRDIYNEGFALLRGAIANGPSGSAVPMELYTSFGNLLHAYASDVCYAIGDDGFLKSSRLMEFSLLQQLITLGLISKSDDNSWQQCATLDDLIVDLGGKVAEQLGTLDRALDQITPHLLTHTLEEHGEEKVRHSLSETLIRLCYSHQNTDVIRENGPRQRLLQKLTEEAIGSTTAEQQKVKAEYLYNRCVFMLGFEQFNTAEEKTRAQIASYTPVLEQFSIAYGKNSPESLGKLSQVENMCGILTMKLKLPTSFEQALSHFALAYYARESIAEPQDPDQRWTHHFLLNNIRSSLVPMLMSVPLCNEKTIELAREQVDAMEKFVKESENQGRNHDYFKGYRAVIQYFRLKFPMDAAQAT